MKEMRKFNHHPSGMIESYLGDYYYDTEVDEYIRTQKDRITSLESQLADALAANQVMREALKAAQLAIHCYDYTDTKDVSDKYIKAERLCAEAIAFKPGDVTLIHIGNYCVEDTLHGVDLLRTDIKPGSMVYAIQTKE